MPSTAISIAEAPRYVRLAETVAKLIGAGTLRPGERVPSVRKAAQQHRVSVTTVLEAYVQLESRGLIEARPKSGYFVRPQLLRAVPEPVTSRPPRAASPVRVASLQSRLFDAARMPELVPFGAAYPGTENLPAAKLSRIMAAVTRQAGPAGLAYDMPPGAELLRRQVARRALEAGSQLTPEEIITTCGGTEALALCLRAVAKPGETVAVESPTYFGVLQAIEGLGLKALEIPTHPRHGMDVDALEITLRRTRIAACLAVTNFSNPLGSLMPEAHKQRLLELLTRREIPLIEDDINGELVHEGPRPRTVHSYDRAGLVLLCGSFAKTLAPGYRVGWVAPGRFFEQVKTLKFTSTLATPTLPQLAIAEYLAHGGYEHHLRSLRRRLAGQLERVSAAVTASFPSGIKLARPTGGFVLWVELPRTVSALALHERALAEGISIAPGPMFSARQGYQHFIRLNCGHAWSERFARAIDRLAVLVKELQRA
jgi:DNA-binding transcriptional MocR family regulator